jgi:hypothetical protein
MVQGTESQAGQNVTRMACNVIKQPQIEEGQGDGFQSMVLAPLGNHQVF